MMTATSTKMKGSASCLCICLTGANSVNRVDNVGRTAIVLARNLGRTRHLQPHARPPRRTTHPRKLTINSIVTADSLGTALGSTVWHSFIGGPTAYKALPRQQFGHLQSRLFPRFFALQTTSALALLGLYARGGGKVSWTGWWRSGSDRTVQALMLLVLTGAANWIVVGPWTTGESQRGWDERCSERDSAQRLIVTSDSLPQPS